MERLGGQRKHTVITVEDLLANPGFFGYIAGSEQDGYYAYGPPLEDDDRRHKITTGPVDSEDLAYQILLDYLNETPAAEPSHET